LETSQEQPEVNTEDSGTPSPPSIPAGQALATAARITVRRESIMPTVMGLPVGRLDTVVMVVLAAAADFCLYGRPGGTGSACLLVTALAGLIVARRGTFTRRSCVLAVIVLFTAALTAWRQWWLLHVVGWVSLFAFAVKGRRPEWPLLEALVASGQTVLQAPLRLAGHFRRREKDDAPPNDSRADATPRPKMRARVVVIPISVTVLFLLIFAAANPVVARLFATLGENIADFFHHIGDYVTVARLSLWLLWLMLFAALIRPAMKSRAAAWLRTYNETLSGDNAAESEHDAFAIAFGTLISVNVLFLAYNAMDSVYLYFKATLPEGITWTDYTHRGCGWLTLGLLISSVVIGVIFRGGLNFHQQARRLKLLSYVWAAQNALLAIGSMRRLQMYIDFSGLTHLRITGIYGSLLVAAGLAIMVYKVRTSRSFIWLVRRYVLAFCVALTVLSLTPNEWLCATYNVKKIAEYKPRALRPVFLKDLSPEALPPLIPLLDYTRDDGDALRQRMVREGVAALLGRHLKQLEADASGPWTQQHGSARWALKRLRAARDRIYATAPPDEWRAARNRILKDYDLSSPEAVVR